jgi:hypothetical protein
LQASPNLLSWANFTLTNAIKHMQNLTANSLKMHQINNAVLKQCVNQGGNQHFYPSKLKLSDAEVIALSIYREYINRLKQYAVYSYQTFAYRLF